MSKNYVEERQEAFAHTCDDDKDPLDADRLRDKTSSNGTDNRP